MAYSTPWTAVRQSHALQTLGHAPLLLAWLMVGPLVAFIVGGPVKLLECIVNLILVGLWVTLIRWLTPTPAAPPVIRRPQLELGVGLALFGVMFVVQLFFFGIWRTEPWRGWLLAPDMALERTIPQWATLGAPAWALQDLYLAASSTVKQLLPTLVAALLLGIGWRGLGFKPGYMKLTVLLLALTMLLGLPFGLLTTAPLSQVITLYLIGLFVNGLPEEVFFRGLLLPRLEALLGHPLNALVVTAWLFNAIHIPQQLANGTPLSMALLGVFSLAFPSGLVWGYLYLRTRSIVPGALWHAAHGRLGILLAYLG